MLIYSASFLYFRADMHSCTFAILHRFRYLAFCNFRYVYWRYQRVASVQFCLPLIFFFNLQLPQSSCRVLQCLSLCNELPSMFILMNKNIGQRLLLIFILANLCYTQWEIQEWPWGLKYTTRTISWSNRVWYRLFIKEKNLIWAVLCSPDRKMTFFSLSEIVNGQRTFSKRVKKIFLSSEKKNYKKNSPFDWYDVS